MRMRRMVNQNNVSYSEAWTPVTVDSTRAHCTDIEARSTTHVNDLLGLLVPVLQQSDRRG